MSESNPYKYKELDKLFELRSPQELGSLLDEILYVIVLHSQEYHFNFGPESEVFFYVMKLRDIFEDLKPIA
jgi:hypothetical protein